MALATSNLTENDIYMKQYNDHGLPVLTCCAADIVEVVLKRDRRLLLYGPPGVGKSTLAAQLAGELVATGRNCYRICADQRRSA